MCSPAWQEDNLARLAKALTELEAILKGLPPSVALPPISAAILRTMDVGTWRTTAGDIDVLQGIPADHRWRLSEFDTLKGRALQRQVGGCTVYVAALDDLVTSKRVAARPPDLEALPELEALQALAQSQQPAGPASGSPPLGAAGYPPPPPLSRPEQGFER
jgi:hypothetical protein